MSNFSSLGFEGLVFVRVEKIHNDELRFFLANGSYYSMCHSQSCCESVTIDDISGDLDDLINIPIILAEERSEAGDEEGSESSTWTFYEIQTIKGSVNIRWYGESNGYYSEDVNVTLVKA